MSLYCTVLYCILCLFLRMKLELDHSLAIIVTQIRTTRISSWNSIECHSFVTACLLRELNNKYNLFFECLHFLYQIGSQVCQTEGVIETSWNWNMVDYILELILTSRKYSATRLYFEIVLYYSNWIQWIMALKTQRQFYRANTRKPV